MVEEKKKDPQNVILENRKKASISGVSDVDSFDERTIVLFTNLGQLTVKGHNLHINRLNVETGEVVIDGDIDSFVYSEKTSKKASGFVERLLK